MVEQQTTPKLAALNKNYLLFIKLWVTLIILLIWTWFCWCRFAYLYWDNWNLLCFQWHANISWWWWQRSNSNRNTHTHTHPTCKAVWSLSCLILKSAEFQKVGERTLGLFGRNGKLCCKDSGCREGWRLAAIFCNQSTTYGKQALLKTLVNWNCLLIICHIPIPGLSSRPTQKIFLWNGFKIFKIVLILHHTFFYPC